MASATRLQQAFAGLQPGAVVIVVGGGLTGIEAPAVRAPWHGRDRVARILINFGRVFGAVGAIARKTTVNGQPGAIILDAAGHVISVMTVDAADGPLRTVHSLINPTSSATSAR